jgi:hypothetical protein
MQKKHSYTVVRRSGRKVVRRDMHGLKSTPKPSIPPIGLDGEPIAVGTAGAVQDASATTAECAGALGHTSTRTTINACSALAEQGELLKSWTYLLEFVEAPTWHGALRPFANYCVGEQIAPAGVNDDVLHRYLARLHAKGKNRWPRTTARRVAQAWNAQVEAVEEWPATKLSAPIRGA